MRVSSTCVQTLQPRYKGWGVKYSMQELEYMVSQKVHARLSTYTPPVINNVTVEQFEDYRHIWEGSFQQLLGRLVRLETRQLSQSTRDYTTPDSQTSNWLPPQNLEFATGSNSEMFRSHFSLPPTSQGMEPQQELGRGVKVPYTLSTGVPSHLEQLARNLPPIVTKPLQAPLSWLVIAR